MQSKMSSKPNQLSSFSVPLLLFLFVFVFLFRSANTEIGLKSVAVVIRHGDRTPLHFYPNDENKDEKIWTPLGLGLGLGAITNKGEKRLNESAMKFYERYAEFMSSKEESIVVDVFETKEPRTKKTADDYLKIILPDYNSSKIHRQKNDQMLSAKAYCPKSDQLWQKWQNSTQIRSLWMNETDFIDSLQNKTGYDYHKNETEMLMRLSWLYETLALEKQQKLKLPDWANQETMDKLKGFQQSYFQQYFNTIELQRIRGHLFFKNLNKYMKPDDHQNRILIYSTNDMMEALFLQILGVYEQLAERMPPSFANTIIIEIYQNRTINKENETIDEWGNQYVRFLYQDVLDDPKDSAKFKTETVSLKPEYCTENITLGATQLENVCQWEKLMERIKAQLEAGEWKDECQTKGSGSFRPQHFGPLTFIIGSVALVLLFW